MKIDRQEVGTVSVISPRGAIVDEDVGDFSALMAKKMAAPHPRIVVDMKDVPYVDSAALECMVEVAEGLSRQSGRLKLAGATSTCREILELTGLASRFQFFERVQDAVRSFL